MPHLFRLGTVTEAVGSGSALQGILSSFLCPALVLSFSLSVPFGLGFGFGGACFLQLCNACGSPRQRRKHHFPLKRSAGNA